MSGRRSSNADGTPAAATTGTAASGATGSANVEGGWPIRIAIALHAEIERLRRGGFQLRLRLRPRNVGVGGARLRLCFRALDTT